MNSLTISFNAKTAPGYLPSINFVPGIISPLTINKFISRIAPQIRKNHPIEFSSVLAHEVRNPLTNINLSVQMLESLVKDDYIKTYLDIISRNSVRINDLLNEFLKQQEPDEAASEKHSIQELLDEVLTMNTDRIKLKNIVVKKEYDVSDYKIALNRAEIKIALTNIMINAIDAMSAGKGELKLVTKSVYGSYIIQIEDNGCGIREEDLIYIFKPYFTNKPGGLGLGLAATYDILLLNHVVVKVESEEKGGTRFTLMFDKNTEYTPFVPVYNKKYPAKI